MNNFFASDNRPQSGYESARLNMLDSVIRSAVPSNLLVFSSIFVPGGSASLQLW